MKFRESPDISSGEKAELRKEYLKKFIDFRDNYIDDLPAKKLELGDKNYYLYKCRGNFFQAVVASVENMIIEETIINPEAIEKGKEFLEYAQKIDFSKFTTEKDINKINEIINCIIESLQDK